MFPPTLTRRLLGFRVFLALCACALLAPRPAGADTGRVPWFRETVSLRAAAIFAFIDSDVEYKGIDIDLESDLGLDEFEVLPSIDMHWRFTRNKKHRLELGYFSVLRSGTRNIDFDLELPNNVVIPINARTETDFDVHIASLTYGYSILHGQRKELGIVAGLDFIVADASVTGRVSGMMIEIEDDLIEEGFNVPFPTAGLLFNWAFSDRLAILSRFQYFGIKFESVEGSLFRGNLRVEHQTFRHVNLFLGYDFLGANVGLSGKLESIELFDHGPMVGIDVRF